MSEERHCVLCHRVIWFGAYGTTERHVDYSPNPEFYESREKVCETCIKILNELPMILTEEETCRKPHIKGTRCDWCSWNK